MCLPTPFTKNINLSFQRRSCYFLSLFSFINCNIQIVGCLKFRMNKLFSFCFPLSLVVTVSGTMFFCWFNMPLLNPQLKVVLCSGTSNIKHNKENSTETSVRTVAKALRRTPLFLVWYHGRQMYIMLKWLIMLPVYCILNVNQRKVRAWLHHTTNHLPFFIIG